MKSYAIPLLMRFVTWNCGKGFRVALPHLMELAPDIACLQEIRPSDLGSLPPGYAARYVPSDKGKGLAVLYKSADWQVSEPISAAEIVASFDVTGEFNFRLIGIWPVIGSTETYNRQQHKALTAHPEWLDGSVMLAGDWNSHPRWDGRQTLTHSSLVEKLTTHGFESVYHSTTGHPHGSAEEEPTYLHQYKPSQPFHIDYIFLSKDLMAKKPSLKVETFAGSTTRPSDHNAFVLNI